MPVTTAAVPSCDVGRASASPARGGCLDRLRKGAGMTGPSRRLQPDPRLPGAIMAKFLRSRQAGRHGPQDSREIRRSRVRGRCYRTQLHPAEQVMTKEELMEWALKSGWQMIA